MVTEIRPGWGGRIAEVTIGAPRSEVVTPPSTTTRPYRDGCDLIRVAAQI